MKLRKILIIHGSRSVRRLLKTYIVSELTDVLIFEAETPEDGAQQLQDQKFEVVICGKISNELGKTFIHKTIEETGANKDTPIIILTSTCSVENIDELIKDGVKHYLVIPFSQFELRDKINEVCEPRSWREHDRVSIPDTKAIIHMDNGDVEVDVINLSESGILCDIESTEQYGDLLNSAHITVKFSAKYGGAMVKILWCKLFRAIVLKWNEDYFPKCSPGHMRVVWQIIKISDHDKKVIKGISEKVNQNNLKEANWLNQNEVDKVLDDNK